MASEFVTRWLEERTPGARVTDLGRGDDGVHIWDLELEGSDHTFRLGVLGSVVEDEALLSERLMELDTQGWIDQAGAKDIWVLVGTGEVAEGPSLFGGGGKVKPPVRVRARSVRGRS
jgi:hypothetical protein